MIKKEETRPLYGLILAGGKSSRMGKDKATLSYYGKNQIRYCYELLTEFCDQVFISRSKSQEIVQDVVDLPHLYDQRPFVDIGPMGGILSAMSQYPNVDWLILAVDLPFVSQKTIANLVKNRDREKVATAYKSSNDELPEPLCAIYQAHAQKNLKAYFEQGQLCPRKFLKQSNVKLLTLANENELDNVNDPHDYKRAKSTIGKTVLCLMILASFLFSGETLFNQLSFAEIICEDYISCNAKFEQEESPEIITITYEELMDFKKNEIDFTLLDVRQRHSFKNGHIEGAHCLPLHVMAPDYFSEQLPDSDKKEKLIVVYCQSYQCPMSSIAAKILTYHGFNVVDYKGGYQEWMDKQKEQKPIVQKDENKE